MYSDANSILVPFPEPLGAFKDETVQGRRYESDIVLFWVLLLVEESPAAK